MTKEIEIIISDINLDKDNLCNIFRFPYFTMANIRKLI